MIENLGYAVLWLTSEGAERYGLRGIDCGLRFPGGQWRLASGSAGVCVVGGAVARRIYHSARSFREGECARSGCIAEDGGCGFAAQFAASEKRGVVLDDGGGESAEGVERAGDGGGAEDLYTPFFGVGE